MTKDPLKQLVKSLEWIDGYKVGVEYGISKERKYPQILRYGVKVKSFIIKKFISFEEARNWAIWNYKGKINYFTIVDLNSNQP